MTDEELVVEFALTRLDNPGLELEEIAALVVRRVGVERMVEFAAMNLGTRGELRGAVFPSAVDLWWGVGLVGGFRDVAGGFGVGARGCRFAG